MLKLVRVAVTGGLASGKSSACRIFKKLGAYVVSADEIVHQLLSPTTLIGQQVIDLIGADVIINNQIDRSRIAKKVFNQPQLLHALEDLLHPAVRQEMEKLYREVSQNGIATLFVAEIPLLFETKGEKHFDYTIAVVADLNKCQQRFSSSTGKSIEEFDKRASRQLSQDEKARRADFVIYNNGNLADMESAVANIYKMLIQPFN